MRSEKRGFLGGKFYCFSAVKAERYSISGVPKQLLPNCWLIVRLFWGIERRFRNTCIKSKISVYVTGRSELFGKKSLIKGVLKGRDLILR